MTYLYESYVFKLSDLYIFIYIHNMYVCIYVYIYTHTRVCVYVTYMTYMIYRFQPSPLHRLESAWLWSDQAVGTSQVDCPVSLFQ